MPTPGGRRALPLREQTEDLSFSLLSLWLSATGIRGCLRKGHEGYTNGSPSFVMFCGCLSVTFGVLPPYVVRCQFPFLDPVWKVARKEAVWNGLPMLEWCLWASARAGEVWGKETAPMRPRTRQIVLGGVCKAPGWVSVAVLARKVRLQCTVACSSASYFAFANLQNKISFYLCSLTRTDREKSSSSRASLGPAFHWQVFPRAKVEVILSCRKSHHFPN